MTVTSIDQASNPLAALARQQQAAAPSGAASANMADQFLKLLVTQLNNQDPLNPLDNAQLTSQLAQINTVQGIQQLNSTLTGISGRFDSAGMLQAASIMGRNAVVAGNALPLFDTGAAGGFELAQGADRVTVTVKDSSGAVVHTVELGAQSEGRHLFDWDGMNDAGTKAAPGPYTFSVSASSAGKAVDSATLSIGTVVGIAPGAGGPVLSLGGVGNVNLTDVKQIL